KAMLDAGQDIFLLDVRTPDEYNAARIPGGVLIPLGKVRTSLDKIPHDKPVIAFCKISLRGYEAALILKANGYTNVKVMDGGVVMWPYGLEN
ncbi:MAG: rhodanese-like domain-containing protein, partial [Sedimentisphaerales bacterium]|nr:rhodanese-like domain-containing protein [Sedimentisphaerales bacterium]